METFRLAVLQLPTELPVSVPSQLVEQRPTCVLRKRSCGL
jgi:hypothetical protein